jgi:hypothetical protein
MTMKLKGVMAVAAFVTLAGAAIVNAQSAARPNPSAPTAQSPATAQDPPAAQNPSPSERGGRESTVSGELTRVAPETKMFTVKNATGEIQFKYSEQTVITGAQKTVAGLATMSGEQVTVTYRVDGGTNMATKIDVKEKK